MRRLLAFIFLGPLLLHAACGGGGGGGNGGGGGPTAPSNQVVVSVILGTTQGGVQEATLTLDGRELAKGNWSSFSGGCAAGCTVLGSTSDVSLGTHTVSLTVTRQSRTTVSYIAIGQVVFTTSGGGSRVIDLPRRDVTLRAGQAVTYSVPL